MPSRPSSAEALCPPSSIVAGGRGGEPSWCTRLSPAFLGAAGPFASVTRPEQPLSPLRRATDAAPARGGSTQRGRLQLPRHWVSPGRDGGRPTRKGDCGGREEGGGNDVDKLEGDRRPGVLPAICA